MADLRIVDAPLLSIVKGTEKIPTGGEGNFSVSVNQVADFAKSKWFLATEEYVDNAVGNVQADLNLHKNNSSNPHGVTKLQVGLGNVDNTADLDKPVSNATQSAIITANSGKADKSYVDSQDQLKADKNTVEASLLLKADKVDLTASKISSDSNQTQQTVNDFGGAKWYAKVGGYELGATVKLDNGDTVKSTEPANIVNPNVDMTGWVLESLKSVSNPSDLATLQNPKNGQRAYVESLQKTFIYDVNLAIPENGVTIVGKWEMQIQDVYYASWFCQGSTPLLPKQDEFMIGYSYAVSKNRPFVVDLPIYVNSTRKQSGFYNQVHYAVVVLSNSTLQFNPEGKLIQIGVDEAAYSILSLYGADNFRIRNPRLEGDKYTKTGDIGEAGFGLSITGCSNGIIEYPEVSACRGDGIYLGQEYYNNNASNLIPKNIKIIKPTILDSYRNGLALSAGDDVYFDAPFIDVVEGTAPQACIDIEPEEGLATRSYLKNVIVHNATLLRGKSSGVLQWIANSRDVDVKFTGTTTISGCYAVLGCNGSSEDWSTVTCNGSITFEKIVFDQRITNNTEGYFDVSVPTRGKGIGIIIDTLEIHTQAPSAGYQIPFLFNGRYTHSGNFKINQMSITDHANTTVVNMVRKIAGSTKLEHIKIPIPDNRLIHHYDAVGTYTCGDYVDVGGYEQRAVAIVNADALLANTQLFTPLNDGTGAFYSRVSTTPSQGRKLKYLIDTAASNIGFGVQTVTPFLEVARIECVDKGGFVQIDNTGAIPMISSIFRKWSLGDIIVNQ